MKKRIREILCTRPYSSAKHISKGCIACSDKPECDRKLAEIITAVDEDLVGEDEDESITYNGKRITFNTGDLVARIAIGCMQDRNCFRSSQRKILRGE